MEWLGFVQIIAVPVVAYVIWQMAAIKRDLEVHKLHVAERYMSKDDAEKTETKIYAILDRMNMKLDRIIERTKELT